MQPIIARSKTVLNIHYYKPNVFEIFRANECLSHHCNFVSEHSLHSTENYKDIVKFGELHDLKDLLSSVDEFKHDISHLDNTEEIRKALKTIPKKLFTFATNNNNMFSKYKLKGVSQLVFRDANRNLISITKDNITDDLAEIAIANGKAHCFEVLSEIKKNVNLKLSPLPPVTSILTEVPKEGSDLKEAQPVQEEVSTEVKKRGRPAKSKE
jgi:hypothetical protein